MKAVVCRKGELEVADLADPRPIQGQILLDVKRAGICGGDLHLRTNLDDSADMAAAAGYDSFSRPDHAGVVFGHEFSAEIAEYGPRTQRRWKPGTPVVAMPMRRDGRRCQTIGASPEASGSYAEQMVVQESLTLPVPNGLSAEHAALTEPMAVGWHAVRRSRIGKRQTAYVIGCGPIGLAVIAMLKGMGVPTVVASDLSPRRRELAAAMGADTVVDPRDADVFHSGPTPNPITRIGGLLKLPNAPWSVPNTPELWNLQFDAAEKLRRRSSIPWWYLFRGLHALNKDPSGPVVFECTGVPGMIGRLIEDAPTKTRIIVVGACMDRDTFRPGLGIFKEAEILFSVGYNLGEFRDTLHMLADGTVDPAPLITATVGLAGVEAAFTALANPEQHAKILIDPASSATTP